MTSKESILSSLHSADAQSFPKPDLSELERQAMKFDDPLDAFCKAVGGAGGKVIDSSDISSFAAEADSFAVKGVFGVAENGAVWVDNLPAGSSRRDLFIHEQLVIELDRLSIVNNMHEAYLRLGEKASGYGIFISGPSKTADIEQALVFGAHGARSVVVVLV